MLRGGSGRFRIWMEIFLMSVVSAWLLTRTGRARPPVAFMQTDHPIQLQRSTAKRTEKTQWRLVESWRQNDPHSLSGNIHTRLRLAQSPGSSSSIPGNLLKGSQADCGPAAKGTIGRRLGCREYEKKHDTTIFPDTTFQSLHVQGISQTVVEESWTKIKTWLQKAGVDPHGKNKLPTWRM